MCLTSIFTSIPVHKLFNIRGAVIVCYTLLCNFCSRYIKENYHLGRVVKSIENELHLKYRQ